MSAPRKRSQRPGGTVSVIDRSGDPVLSPEPHTVTITSPLEYVDIDSDDGDVKVPGHFIAECRFADGLVAHLELVAERGRVRAVKVVLEAEDEGALHGLTLEKVKVRQMVEHATVIAARYRSSSVPDIDPLRRAAAAATRRRVSDERLENIADIYNSAETVEDAVESVEEAEHVGRRHAFRLIAAARKAGLIEEES